MRTTKLSFPVNVEKIFDIIGEIFGVASIVLMAMLALNAQFNWLALLFDYLGVVNVTGAVRIVWFVMLIMVWCAVTCSGCERMAKRGLIATAVFLGFDVFTLIMLIVNCSKILAI